MKSTAIRRMPRLLLGLLLVAGPTGARGAAITPVRSYKDVRIAPLTWSKPEPKIITLKNGATLYLLEDHRLPLVNVMGMVRTGSLYDPAGRAGTASLVGTMLRTGGTTKRSWEEVDREVDRLAMDISTGVGSESGNASITVLSEKLEPGLNLLFEMLRDPAFDPEKLALAKEKSKENIRRQNDNPLQIAIRELRGVVYGKEHPRGFTPTFQTVDAITRQDLVDFHHRYYVPGNMLIGVAGDVDPAKIARQLEAAMGNWPNRPVTLPPVPDVPYGKPKALYEANKATATQSTILISRLTLKRGDPDQAALEVADFILGSGGFTSRITEKVRSDRGLAYVAGSVLQTGDLQPGPEIVYALSKSESTIEALRIMLDEIGRMRNEPVQPEEMKKAVNALLNGEVFNYDKPEKVIGETLDLAYYGYPQDLPARRLKALAGISAGDVQNAARKYLSDETLQVLVVGAVDKFDGKLADLGTVNTIELKDPTKP